MGNGNTTTSSAMAAVLLGRSPEEVTGRGAGLDDEGLKRKVAAIRKAVAVSAPDPGDALDVLAKVGGLDIAGMAGLYIGGAAAGIPVVVDGFISAVAALTAVRLAPACRDYILPSHVSAEPAGAMMLAALGFEPLLTCGMCLGEGTGAVAALGLFDLAATVYRDMATFGDIAIQQYVYFDTPKEEEKLTC
jgi:nicotinate-nucleotide--dimethylbenzimidazole phosphoribosyltransferase